MYIKSIKIENYKGFHKSGVIPFTKGFNVIVGKNGVGKTALLEALELRKLLTIPHKSPETVPKRGISVGGNNIRRVDMSFDFEDFKSHIPNNSFHVNINYPQGIRVGVSQFAEQLTNELSILSHFSNAGLLPKIVNLFFFAKMIRGVHPTNYH